MMKSKLYKLDGLTHSELKANITKVIKDIPKEKYENIIKGTYNRSLLKIHQIEQERKRIIYKAYVKLGVLNVQRCKTSKKHKYHDKYM